MYAIRKAPSLAKYRGRLDNVFVTVIGLLTILNIVYKPSQLAASSTENLIEDEPQLMTSTTGYSFMSITPLVLSLIKTVCKRCSTRTFST
jgi:hypothetical protein